MPQSKRRPYRLLSERLDIGDIGAIIRGFKLGIQGKEHQDRAAVLVCASLLEQVLEDAIWAHAVPHAHDQKQAFFSGAGDQPGVVRSLADKIFLAYVLGVIGPETRKDLRSIRQIRNVFAHAKRHVDFGTPEIREACVFSIRETNLWKRATGNATLTVCEVFVQTVEIVVAGLLGDDRAAKVAILR
jgi:hypothetical protein